MPVDSKGIFLHAWLVIVTIDNLLQLVEPFRAKRMVGSRHISLARLSRLVFKDNKRLKNMLESNSDCSSRNLRAAFQWFSDNWPEGAVWPDHVPRPEPTPISTTVPTSSESRASQ